MDMRELQRQIDEMKPPPSHEEGMPDLQWPIDEMKPPPSHEEDMKDLQRQIDALAGTDPERRRMLKAELSALGRVSGGMPRDPAPSSAGATCVRSRPCKMRPRRMGKREAKRERDAVTLAFTMALESVDQWARPSDS